MHKVLAQAQNKAEATIDENVWTRLEAEQTTDEWKMAIDEMNQNITEKIKFETDPTANPNKKYTKIQEFNILDNYRMDDGQLCYKCTQGKHCEKHGGQKLVRQDKKSFLKSKENRAYYDDFDDDFAEDD